MSLKAGPNLRCTMDVVDFGDISVERSTDNPGLTRLTLNDEVGTQGSVHFDLSNDELIGLINALSMYVED